jgi:ectoine hydroxylase-related dioxygenase (phytanoyl-CoA dioxygenase family)
MPTSQPARHPRLTPVEVEHFRREGYLLPRDPVLPDADFRDLCATFESMLADWTAHGGRPEAMDVPHFYHPELMRWLMHPAVLDLVEPILGPDIALFSSHFICKPAGDGRRVPWHEDSAYWRGQWDPMEVVTIWLAIDESDLANGCMQVVPRTHHAGYSDYAEISERAVFNVEIKAGTFDPAKAVPCILAPNHASLHHAKLIHGSTANTSTRRRCGYTMRYISTASRFEAQRNNDGRFQIYLARGVDRAGNTYADPTRPNQRWIDHFGVHPPRGH